MRLIRVSLSVVACARACVHTLELIPSGTVVKLDGNSIWIFLANPFFLYLLKYKLALIFIHKTHPWGNSFRVKVTMAARSMKSTLNSIRGFFGSNTSEYQCF